MAVINTASGLIGRLGMQNSIQARGERDVMRDANAARSQQDIERRMALQQIESSQRDFQSTMQIVQGAGQGVAKGVELGSHIAAAPEATRAHNDLTSNAAQYQNNRDALLDTDLGEGVTVAQSLGSTDREGNPVTDPAQQREIAGAKLDAIMSGNFNDASDLRALGFSDREAQTLMGLKSSGDEITQEEAVNFLYNRSPVVQRDNQISQTAGQVSTLFTQALQPLTQGTKGAENGTRAARNAVEQDLQSTRRNRGNLSRIGWLAVEQQAQAGQATLNARNKNYGS